MSPVTPSAPPRTADELRNAFTGFFAERGHQVVPSASLIPHDPTVLFTVADLKSLIIRVNLNEVDIAKVLVGQPVRITLDAYPQKVFTGKVSFVSPSAEPGATTACTNSKRLSPSSSSSKAPPIRPEAPLMARRTGPVIGTLQSKPSIA